MTPAVDSTQIDITVLYFSVLREKLGRSSEQVSLESGASGADLLDKLSKANRIISEYRSVIRLAINTAYARETQQLSAGDEVAIITPVSGG